MNPSNRFLRIPLADIRMEDTRFQITAGQGDLFALAHSIKTAGLINPPVVWSCDTGYIPVCGFRRILAARTLRQMDTLTCRIMSGACEADCAVLAVADNAFSRELAPSDQIRAVGLLHRFMTSEQMAQKSMGIFNKKLNARFITELLAVSAMPAKALTLILNKRLSLKPAMRLTGYDQETIDALLDIFARIKASSGKQLDIITCFTEVCKRDKIAAASLLVKPRLQAILNQDTADVGQKADQVRQYLTLRRFPELEQTRQKVKSRIGRLQSQQTIRFIVPENFESISYGVSFDFTTVADFRQQVHALTAMADDPDLKAVLQR